MKKKVVVGISGGVDSSVAAFLLKKKYEVVGVHLNLGCALNTAKPARSMASKLDIPFYALNLKKEFGKKVIDYFIREYSKGHTPNPCVVCNKKIKFKALLKKAKELKADYVATGHYAKVVYNKKRKRYLLKKGKDRKKDQSYVLCGLDQKQLGHTLFPLANFTKEEVKEKAKELGVYHRPASQEICFVPNTDYHGFLKKRMSTDRLKKGLIVDREGEVLGKHKGIAFYTIGQRRGLGITTGKPLYVIAIDSDKDVIVVGSEEEILKDELIARDVNWVAIDRLKKPIKVRAKIRYQHREAEATVTPRSLDRASPVRGNPSPKGTNASPLARTSNGVKVKFKRPQRAITPGQAVVFYDKDVVIGGGWIV